MGVFDLLDELTDDELQALIDDIFPAQVSEDFEAAIREEIEAADVTLREDAVERNPVFADLEVALGLEPSEPPVGPLPGEPEPEDAIRERTEGERRARPTVIDLLQSEGVRGEVDVLLVLARALEQVDASFSPFITQDRIDTLLPGDREELAERAPYVSYATPRIVLAIALVSFSLDVLPVVYKTIPLLVFAYVVRFMPQAIGSIRTSTLQVDRRLVEAARTLERSRVSAFRAVTLPLIAPGIGTGAALVFLTTMKEFPATPVLRPLQFDILVTYIWRVQ